MKIKNKLIKRDLNKYADSIAYKFGKFPYSTAEALVKEHESKWIFTLLLMTIPKEKRHHFIKVGKWELFEIPVAGNDFIVLIYCNDKQNKELTIEIYKNKLRWEYSVCQYDPNCFTNIEFDNMVLALDSLLSEYKKYDWCSEVINDEKE